MAVRVLVLLHGRLAAWLVAQAAATVPNPGGTQQALADHLGTTRVTLNGALARLRRDGLIELRGAAIERIGVGAAGEPPLRRRASLST